MVPIGHNRAALLVDRLCETETIAPHIQGYAVQIGHNRTAQLMCRAKLKQSRRTIDVPCKTETIAPHIHVLYRDIPFILNIIT
jgi:hypothetical protein